MADQSSRILQHPVIQALDSLEASLERAATQATSDPNALDLIGRLRAMREHARSTLTGADPFLVTDPALSAAQGTVQRIDSHLTSFSNGSGITSLNNAMGEADALFSILCRVPAPITGPRASAVTRALGAYQEAIEQYTKGVQRQLAEVQTRVSQFTTSLATAEQRVASMEARIDSAIAQYQSTFDSTQAQRQQTFDNTQSQRQQAFDTEVANHRTAVNEITQQFRTNSAALIDSAKGQLADAVKDLDDALGQTRAAAIKAAHDLDIEYRGIADALKAHLETRRDEADKLVGLIGERGVTSTYQKTADQAKREMIVWHFLTVLVLGGLLLGAFVEFVPALKNGWNWGIGGARLMVAIIATLLASYTGAQAKMARDTMQRNRRREMDLAALGPYLQPLPTDLQNEFRTRVADRYFAQHDGAPSGNGPTVEALLADPEIVAAIKGMPKTALLTAIKTVAAK